MLSLIGGVIQTVRRLDRRHHDDDDDLEFFEISQSKKDFIIPGALFTSVGGMASRSVENVSYKALRNIIFAGDFYKFSAEQGVVSYMYT